MRPVVVVSGLVLAVALGCGRKAGEDRADTTTPAKDEPPSTPSRGPAAGGPPPKVVPGPADAGGKAEPAAGERKAESDLPPPWPPLPPVPQRPASYPNTDGGRVAHALDFAADHFVTMPRPPERVLWADWAVAGAFKEIGAVLPTLPKRQADRDAFGPAVDAARDRDLIDAAFARVLAGWVHYRERDRRWHVEISEAATRTKRPELTPRQLREAAERIWPPGRQVRIGTADLKNPATRAHDWVQLEASGDAGGGTINEAQTTVVIGRVEYRTTFELNTGPSVVALQGAVGRELRLLVNGPMIVDLTDFRAPAVRVRVNGDTLVRVGPGVGTLGVNPRRGLILARGNPQLRVEFDGDPKKGLAVVAY